MQFVFYSLYPKNLVKALLEALIIANYEECMTHKGIT